MAQYSAQILKTLSDQIKNLSPLRESFKHLQTYYSKLTHQFNDLMSYGERSEVELLGKLRYLEEVHRELEHEFSLCGEELRNAECEQAKQLMQRNQQLAQGEALKSRHQLEMGQKAAAQSKRKDLLQHGSKLQFNISKYKELIHNLELAIKSKEYENADIEREIKKMELINSKITELNKETELNIDSTQDENEKIIEELRELQDKLNSYSKLIQAKEKLNKESVQTLITKTEELEQLKHRKEYIEKLIQTETATQRELIRSNGEIQSILKMKKEKWLLVSQENHQYELAIAQEKAKEQTNKEELQKLTSYLKDLVQTNGILFSELQRSCAQDREVQVMLSEKLQKLMLVNDKITQNEMFNKFDLNSLQPQQKPTKLASSASPSSKKEQKTKYGSTFGSPKNIGLQIEQRLSRERQMASTWGSISKQNYRYDF